MKKQKTASIYFYPVLFSIFAPFSLLAANLNEIRMAVVLRPLLFCLLFGVFVWLTCRILLRKNGKASAATSLLLLLFYSYGHIYQLLANVDLLGFQVGKNRYLLIVFVLVSIGVLFLIHLLKNPPNWVHSVFLVAGLTLVIIPTVEIAGFAMKNNGKTNPWQLPPAPAEVNVSKEQTEQKPDIYYIILDAYTREDAFVRDLDFDNSRFIQNLEDLGFVVADCALSNYSSTMFSMASSFNFDYLLALNPDLADPTGQHNMLVDLVKNPKLKQILIQQGYQWVVIDPGWNGLQPVPPVTYFSPADPNEVLAPIGIINDFEEMLIRTTPGVILFNYGRQVFG